MFTRMDQTIGELENMVARRQGFPDFDRSDFPSPWLLDLLFRLPNHATSAASMVPFEYQSDPPAFCARAAVAGSIAISMALPSIVALREIKIPLRTFMSLAP